MMKKGFSLIEVLLVVTIIGVLAGALIIVIDPAEQFANARNQQREIDLQTLSVALEQYSEDNRGVLPSGLTNTSKSICTSACVTDASQVDLSQLIGYIAEAQLPSDPDQTDESLTGYQIRVTGDGQVNLIAPLAENGVEITTGTSAEETVFRPNLRSDLALWLEASEGVTFGNSTRVASWQDQSANASVLSQVAIGVQPVAETIKGIPVIEFDGVDDYLEGTAADLNGLSALTVVIVAAITSEDNDKEPSDESGRAYSPLFFPQSGSWGQLFLNPQRPEIGWRFGTGLTQTNEIHTRAQDIGGVISSTVAVKDQATETVYVNGTQVAQATGKDSPTANIGTQLQLGRENEGTSSFYRGKIAEIMIFESALTPEEIASMQSYLSGKYGAF